MAPPFMNSTGLITKILDKIISASQPERFTLDYLKTKLGFDSGSARAFIPLLKRIGMISSDGTPTQLYSKFRNPEERGGAMCAAIKHGYKDVYERNEYAHELDKTRFKNLIVEMTGLESDHTTVKGIVGTFFALKSYAKFDGVAIEPSVDKVEERRISVLNDPSPPSSDASSSLGLNLSYTINLNLPETTDVEVFNAIFRSLKENLLKP